MHRPRRLDGSYAMMVAGPGLPAGGLEGMFPRKNSDADFDIVWARIAFIMLQGSPYDNDQLAEALDNKAAIGHAHDDRYYKQDEVDTLIAQLEATIAALQSDLDAAEASIAALESQVALLQPLPLDFNFTDDADAYFLADVAMTVTEQGTIGGGSVAYEKSTAADPTVFSSATSPITLEAGAWLKVVGTGEIAVALKRTA